MKGESENLDYPNINRDRVSGDRQPDMSWNHHNKNWLCFIAKLGTAGSREENSGVQS